MATGCDSGGAKRGRIRPAVYYNVPRMRSDRRRRLKLGMIMCKVLKLIWYVMIGTSLKQIGFAVSYIGRYTRRPVIAEARILRHDAKWVIFRYKDYARGGGTAIKKLRVFDFIARLIRHIPDKHFRMVRHYGIFANRVRGTKLRRARELLGQAEREPGPGPTWRERRQTRTGIGPLICPACSPASKLDARFVREHEVQLSGGPDEPPQIECHWCREGLMVPLKYRFSNGDRFRLPGDMLRKLREHIKTP